MLNHLACVVSSRVEPLPSGWGERHDERRQARCKGGAL